MIRRRRFKLKVEEFKMMPEDREEIIRMHNHIRYLRTRATKEPGLKSILKSEIEKVRQTLKNDYAHKFFSVTLSLGPHKETKLFPRPPEKYDVEEIKETLLKEILKTREQNKTVNYVNREFNGIPYKMVGGIWTKAKIQMRNDRPEEATPRRPTFAVATEPYSEEKPKILPSLTGGGRVFEKPGTVASLLNSQEFANRIRKAKKPYDKSKYVGVEFEVIARMDQENLIKAFIDAKLSGHVYLKHDGSIRIDENQYGDRNVKQWVHEVTLIAKQHQINDIVSRVCQVLNRKGIEAYVNDSCGLHIHLDMRNRSPEICYQNLYYALPILKAMVPYNRTNNRFCVLNNTADFYTAASQNPDETREARYQAINAYSYGVHRTIEVRMHSGSTNATKINNWVNILVAIVERKESVAGNINNYEDMAFYFGLDVKMLEYIKKRMDKFKDKTVDNKSDNLDESA